MIEIGEYRIELVEHSKGMFFKFYSKDCSYRPIIWARLKAGCVKENDEFVISFREPFLTHEFTFFKHYSSFLKVYYKQKIMHVFGFEEEIGVTKNENREYLNAVFNNYC